MRTKDYLFAQDLKYMPGEIANTLLRNFATFLYVFATNLHWYCVSSFSTRHHLIFVLINRELLTVFKKKVEECECDWPSLANGMVGWSLYIVWPFYTCLATLISTLKLSQQEQLTYWAINMTHCWWYPCLRDDLIFPIWLWTFNDLTRPNTQWPDLTWVVNYSALPYQPYELTRPDLT